MVKIRYNPQKLVEELNTVAAGIRLHTDVWPTAAFTPEELEASATVVDKAVKDREKAREDIKKANEVLVKETMKGVGSALGRLQKSRATARLFAADNLGDFGLTEDGIEEKSLTAVIPTDLRTLEVLPFRVTLAWGTQRARVAYQVFMGTTMVHAEMKMIHSGTQARAVIDDLKAGTKYYFAVRAKGKEQPSLFSKFLEVTTLLTL